MKIISSMLVAAILSTSSYLYAEGACSVPSIKFSPQDTQAKKIEIIQDALANYKNRFPSLLSAKSGRYEICFEMLDSIEISPKYTNEKFDGTFTIAPAGKEELLVAGLKLIKASGLALEDKSLIKIAATPGTKVILKNVSISNVVNGIEIQGNGIVKIEQSIISGDSSKSGNCISTSSQSTVIDASVATSCNKGVYIEANNVRISGGSRIYDNKIGVHVARGFRGMDVEKSLIFGNNDSNTQTSEKIDNAFIGSEKTGNLKFYDIFDENLNAGDSVDPNIALDGKESETEAH